VDGVLYSLNAGNGRREGITRSGGWNDAYGYDAAGQVTGASYAANTTGMGSEGFTYDAAGNRTSSVKNGTNVTEYAPNGLDQYSAIGGISQAHDANGNLTTFVPPVAGALPITLKWDGENRLTEITKTGHKVTNVYDALHRRILKKIHDDDTAVIAKTIAFVYDGWNVIQETEYAGSTTTVVNQKRYTWGADVSGSLQGAGGVGGLLMAEETVLSGTTQTPPIPHYYHYDGNGNVIAITDATGTTEGRYRYTAFGGAANTVTYTTFAATQPYRFSTKYLDKEVETAEGLYFYGYRYYLPSIGRWPSRDPIGERGGLNLYGMVGNDATDISDFLGLNENSCPWNCFDKCNDQVDKCPKVNCYVGAFIELGNECRRYKSRNCHSPTGRPRGLSGEDDPLPGGGGGGGCRDPLGFAACVGDIAVNFGLSSIPGVGNALGVLGIEPSLLQGSLNFSQSGVAGFAGREGLVGHAGGLAQFGADRANRQFGNMGGEARLNHLDNLANRNGLGVNLREQRSNLSALKSAAKGLGLLGKLLTLGDTINDIRNCHEKYCK
jgi:RHS repeat-associated protein